MYSGYIESDFVLQNVYVGKQSGLLVLLASRTINFF